MGDGFFIAWSSGRVRALGRDGCPSGCSASPEPVEVVSSALPLRNIQIRENCLFLRTVAVFVVDHCISNSEVSEVHMT